MGAHRVKLDNPKANNGSSKEHFLHSNLHAIAHTLVLALKKLKNYGHCLLHASLSMVSSWTFVVSFIMRTHFIVFSTFFIAVFSSFWFSHFSTFFRFLFCEKKRVTMKMIDILKVRKYACTKSFQNKL